MDIDIKKLDLYALLDVSEDANEVEVSCKKLFLSFLLCARNAERFNIFIKILFQIKKAYRKKALTCHPDKNPDPKAVHLFHQLSKALEILIDETAKVGLMHVKQAINRIFIYNFSLKAAYDRLLRARKASQRRHRELDSKRRKLKDELEVRERRANEDVVSEADATAKFEAEVERLRKEGSKQLEKENEILKQQIAEEIMLKKGKNAENLPRLKFKVLKRHDKLDDTEAQDYFEQFGEVTCLVLSKSGKSGLVEYKNVSDALKMTNAQDVSPKFNLEWLQGKPATFPIFASTIQTEKSNLVNDLDYESLVLRKLRQAEERKRLIAEMDNENSS